MRKVSELLGKPLICLCEGTNAGVVKNISFDKKLNRARWLIIDDGMDSAELAVGINDIFRSGADAVVIKSTNELLPASELGIEPNNPINCDVFTTYGKRLGSVKDVLLHDGKCGVASLELDSREEIPIERVFSSGDTVVVLNEEELLRITTPKPKKPRTAKVKPKPALTAEKKESPATVITTNTETAIAAEIDEWQPPKPEGQKKLIGDYNFLLGRKTNDDIYNKQNEKIIKKNTLITREIVERARAAGKLIDLTVHSLPEHYVF